MNEFDGLLYDKQGKKYDPETYEEVIDPTDLQYDASGVVIQFIQTKSSDIFDTNYDIDEAFNTRV